MTRKARKASNPSKTMFRLFTYRWHKYYTAYAWVNPEGVCFTSRAIAPFGFVRLDFSFLIGMTIQELIEEGLKEAKTNMTQEQLAKGWLLLER